MALTVREVRSRLIMAVVVEAFDGGLLDGTVALVRQRCVECPTDKLSSGQAEDFVDEANFAQNTWFYVVYVVYVVVLDCSDCFDAAEC